jgi:hypothetical protein
MASCKPPIGRLAYPDFNSIRYVALALRPVVGLIVGLVVRLFRWPIVLVHLLVLLLPALLFGVVFLLFVCSRLARRRSGPVPRILQRRLRVALRLVWRVAVRPVPAPTLLNCSRLVSARLIRARLIGIRRVSHCPIPATVGLIRTRLDSARLIATRRVPNCPVSTTPRLIPTRLDSARLITARRVPDWPVSTAAGLNPTWLVSTRLVAADLVRARLASGTVRWPVRGIRLRGLNGLRRLSGLRRLPGLDGTGGRRI